MHVRRHLNRLTQSGGRVGGFFRRLNTLRPSDSTSNLLHPKEESRRLEKNTQLTNPQLRGENEVFGIICTTGATASGVNEESIRHKEEKMKSRLKRLLRDLKSGKEMRKVLRSGFLALGKSMIHASEFLPQPCDFTRFQPHYDDDEFNFQHYKTFYTTQLDTYSHTLSHNVI